MVRIFLLSALVALLGGCTSTVVDPSKAHVQGSTWDFLGEEYEKREEYLEQRRGDLERARIELSDLDEELIRRGVQLRKAQALLESQEVLTRLSERELQDAREAVDEAKELNAGMHRKVMLAQANEERLRGEIRKANEDIKRDEALIVELKGNVSVLSNEVKVAEVAVERLLSLKARQALRIEDGLPDYSEE